MHINLPMTNIILTFWDSLSAAIDKNIELSDVEK